MFGIGIQTPTRMQQGERIKLNEHVQRNRVRGLFRLPVELKNDQLVAPSEPVQNVQDFQVSYSVFWRGLHPGYQYVICV